MGSRCHRRSRDRCSPASRTSKLCVTSRACDVCSCSGGASLSYKFVLTK